MKQSAKKVASGQSVPETPPAEGADGYSWYCFTATYKCVAIGRPRKRHLWQRMFILLRAPEN